MDLQKYYFSKTDVPTPKNVGEFYDRTNAEFIATHGNIFQSFRTYNVEEYLDYTIQSAQLKDNLTVLDAGCGIAGPSIYFAKKVKSIFHGITISKVQAETAKANIEKENLQNSVYVQHGDFHNIADIFGKSYFDRILFLESFGHSQEKEKLLEAAWDVLKPGGILYIKDMFERETDDAFEQKRIKEAVYTVNSQYEFNIGSLYPVLSKLRRLNFILDFIKVPEIDYTQMDRFQVSQNFQIMTQIGLDPSPEDFVFPVDYLEIRCSKPKYDVTKNREIHYMVKQTDSLFFIDK
jgi:ubiquinone/menaquinone biosynthesis C-methylase UbiE